MWSAQTLQLIDIAFAEDLGSAGDITTALLGEPQDEIVARIVPRADGVVCGLALLPTICRHYARHSGRVIVSSPATEANGARADGQTVAAGQTVATVAGPKAAVLAAERTILNFLGRLSGVATTTRHFVEAARRSAPRVQVFDTRKTLPGWRELDKYAVRCGGGHNHRSGLHDAVLIKDNHLADVPPDELGRFLAAHLARRPATARFVEIEVDEPSQLELVLGLDGVDVILLDNFTLDQMRAAVALREQMGRTAVTLEASGGVRLDDIAAVAATGIDRIAVGALTHSAPSLDIGLDTVSA